MGKQARLKKMRRDQRIQEMTGGQLRDTPLRVLRSIHRTIQNACGENSRRCWEYMLEMLAHTSGWLTESNESKHVWDKMPEDTPWDEFYESWMAEVEWAKANRATFSEPLGQLLEEIEGTNDHLGQFMTPMAIVRMMNEINLGGEAVDSKPNKNGLPKRRVLEPCCGTGRFLIDALVHYDDVMVNAVDTDLWMVRTAMMNVRLLAKWSSLRVKDPGDLLKPLRRGPLVEEFNRLTGEKYNQIDRLKDAGAALTEAAKQGTDALIIGGRAIFIHGDALVVDLSYAPNWLCAGWAWGPKPWRSNLKIDGFDGTYDQWEAAGRPPLGQTPPDEPVQFDFSMVDKQPRQRPSRSPP